jgi:two-component system sensor histidine kinase KdpD
LERRPAADFLELVERSRRGRLKIYIGFAAGVGKTYRMLEEAHALKKGGVDIVVAFVETYGRSETEALLEGLEAVPRRVFEYRGFRIEEMDLEAVLARHPQVALVDEVAHTNVPGSKNAKRCQDVSELLNAGISVICAFNIQHLESLKELVEQATQMQIRDTVPDDFLHRADQVVNLDLAVEDLLERLRAGKIYAEDKVERALENLFQPDKLSMLREMALREVAESLGRAALEHTRRPGATPGGSRTPSERVMVCMSSRSPRAGELLRRGSRLAGRLNTDWYAVYVETPAEAPDRIDATSQRMLHTNIEKARELGAQIVRLHGRDRVETLLDFARSHAVGHILVGRSDHPWWRRAFSGDFVARIVHQAENFDLHIVGTHERDHAA